MSEGVSPYRLFVEGVGFLRAVDQGGTMDEKTVKDPVCSMQIKPSEAAAESDYKGQHYYFCAETCRQAFEQDPERYASRAA